MSQESVVFGSTVLGVVVGLVMLIGAEAVHGYDAFVYVGGVVVLASVGVLAGAVMALEEDTAHG